MRKLTTIIHHVKLRKKISYDGKLIGKVIQVISLPELHFPSFGILFLEIAVFVIKYLY